MTKQQVIDILKTYKPSDNIYNGYNSIEEKIDERICYLIDEIIETIKHETDNDSEWIKCSERLPKQESIDGRMVSDCVLVHTSDGDMRIAIYCDNEWLYFAFRLFVLPLSEDVIYWRPLPEPSKEEN